MSFKHNDHAEVLLTPWFENKSTISALNERQIASKERITANYKAKKEILESSINRSAE